MRQQHSDKTQLAALDTAIAFLRRGMAPPRKECDLIADQLGSVRDRVAAAIKHKAERQASERGGR